MSPQLIFDVHLDLSWNAIEFNRDQRWTQERIRRRELGDLRAARGCKAEDIGGIFCGNFLRCLKTAWR